MRLGSPNMKLMRLFEVTSNHERSAQDFILTHQPLYALLVLKGKQPGSAGHSLV
ncbi:MAG TPA: hypothetical protein VL325_03185 [Pyrinomonadaceae bacterium]|nr:hypothetical protein [Pyrinomonadaceae bacterium]